MLPFSIFLRVKQIFPGNFYFHLPVLYCLLSPFCMTGPNSAIPGNLFVAQDTKKWCTNSHQLILKAVGKISSKKYALFPCYHIWQLVAILDNVIKLTILFECLCLELSENVYMYFIYYSCRFVEHGTKKEEKCVVFILKGPASLGGLYTYIPL